MIVISELYIYPVKSLAGIKLEQAELSSFGLKYDRRWLIVDADGLFISQRTLPKMASIKTSFKNNQLTLSHGNNSIEIPPIKKQAKKIKVQVWKDTLFASLVDEKVDHWLSQVLNQKCRLVYMDDSSQRQIDINFAKAKQYVSFADGFPILLVSQASIDDLNSKLDTPININRFRPNIVVSGIGAYTEDNWKDFSINGVEYIAAKPCSRCIMPSINQQTGVKDNTKLLAVLNKYRKINHKVKFGVNILFENTKNIQGEIISPGDAINLK